MGERNLRSVADLLAKRFGALTVACCLVLAAHFSGALRPLDNGVAAVRARLAERDPVGSVVVVEIDTQSLRAAGEWPWARERYAAAIDNLRNAGATLIGFDVDFSARADAAGDEALRTAVEAEPGSIILPVFMQPGSSYENTPLASLSKEAVLGSVNVELDPDGKVRRYRRGYDHFDHYHASMAAILAGARYGDTAPFLIDFGIRQEKIDRLSFEDVYRNAFDPARVRGKAVLVGATALELGDEFATPVRPSTSGVLVHALAFESLVQGRGLVELNGLLVLAIALIALAALWPRGGVLNLRRYFTAHAVLMAATIFVPVVVQALFPVSLNFGLLLFSQALCLICGVQRELARRQQELVDQREAHLSFVALHDPETELPNRRAMLNEMAQRLSGGGRMVVAVVIGIERFSILRGAVGYANANEAVRKLAQRVAQVSGDRRVYHISTSTLGAVFSVPDIEQGRTAYRGVMARLGADAAGEVFDIETNTRVGVAFGAAPDVTAEKLLEQATLSLDRARQLRRNAVEYSVEDAADPMLQLAMVADIRAGLRHGEFTLVYQAKFDTRTRAVVGAEALIRWLHPKMGAIAPDKFITVAEETGSIDMITRWALERAVADQAILRARGIELQLSVNVSARCLCDPGFCDFAERLIQRTRADLCFEITETAVIDNPQTALAALAAFRKIGVKISVDDFGSGLSSLSYLKQIAPDELKVDRSLIGDLTRSLRDQKILKSTIELAHSLRMSVVVEGVEDEKTFAIIAAMGGDSIQGYLLSRPGPLADLARQLLATQTGLRAPAGRKRVVAGPAPAAI